MIETLNIPPELKAALPDIAVKALEAMAASEKLVVIVVSVVVLTGFSVHIEPKIASPS